MIQHVEELIYLLLFGHHFLNLQTVPNNNNWTPQKSYFSGLVTVYSLPKALKERDFKIYNFSNNLSKTSMWPSTTKRSVGLKGYTGLTFRLSRTLTRTLRIFRVPLKGISLRLPWITGVPPWSITTGAYHWKCPKGPYPREKKSKFILLFPTQGCVTTCRHWIWRTVTPMVLVLFFSFI